MTRKLALRQSTKLSIKLNRKPRRKPSIKRTQKLLMMPNIKLTPHRLL
jgi:hypothetical protein